MQRRQVAVRDTLTHTRTPRAMCVCAYAGWHYSYAVGNGSEPHGESFSRLPAIYAREKSIIKMEIFLFARATN